VDFGKTITDAREKLAVGAGRKCTAKHLEDVSSRIDRGPECGQIGMNRGSDGQGSRGWDEMARGGECLVVFALQVGLSNLQVAKGHLGAGVAEQLHNRGEAYAGAEHLRGIGVATLMRHKPAGDSDRRNSIPKDGTEAPDQSLTGTIAR